MSGVRKKSQRLWATRIAEWRNSGLSARAYCSEQGIGYRLFLYHQKRVKESDKKPGIRFMEVQRAIPDAIQPTRPSDGHIKCTFPNGIEIDFQGGDMGSIVQRLFQLKGLNDAEA